ncbi:hypothetical protein [Rheinheimera sp. F8]|uniref:hypothetical protein n=1 Tax=Rheinheimera sp. F8 TaxID=1763998 RepID=UPI000ACE5210|nr:hypothetical protein [Rheinheimera sp. F8]
MTRTIVLMCCSCLLLACTRQEPLPPATGNSSVPVTAEATDINSLADSLKDRWQLQPNGIRWQVKDQHQDHLEFSGEQVSAIIYYGTDAAGQLVLNRKVVWPMLRTLPNDTHASLIHTFGIEVSPRLRQNGVLLTKELPEQVTYDGLLQIQSRLSAGLQLTRTLAPSPTGAFIIEQQTLKNTGDTALTVSVDPLQYQLLTDAAKGVDGSYHIQARSDFAGEITLAPGGEKSWQLSFSAVPATQTVELSAGFSAEAAADTLRQRQHYVQSLQQNLQLETPDPVLNQMFAFAKLRAAESIFRTKGGLLHGPGGGRYYAAIWANDQAEYVNPFFPFLGDANGNESARNSFAHFARFINPAYTALPSSIIAEGLDIWNGAGDRGDCAMVAYGASRYALASGDPQQARQLLPLIDWCLAYNQRQKTADGVIASDSDELENRFPAGKVNLSTNMLAFGALQSSALLYQALGDAAKASALNTEANQLRKAMLSYFAGEVEGYDTWRYYAGNTRLRAWIALPLVMGFNEQKAGTLAALLSPQLWSENGIYTASGDKTFWDRATLYAFRGMFNAGATDTAMKYLKYYSRKRLLGEHVPFAVEAWPEGDQRHLSAESGLYARVITEGLFGIEPTGFDRFTLAPRLPAGWNGMCLRHIRAFASNFDLCVSRNMTTGATPYQIVLSIEGQNPRQIGWDGVDAVELQLKSKQK